MGHTEQAGLVQRHRVNARHGVQAVWIVDVDERVVRFCRRPRDGSYADITATETPGPTAPQVLPDAAVDLATLFR